MQRDIGQERRDHPSLGRSLRRGKELGTIHHPGGQPVTDDPLECGKGLELFQERPVVDAVKAFGDVRIQDESRLGLTAP